MWCVCVWLKYISFISIIASHHLNLPIEAPQYSNNSNIYNTIILSYIIPMYSEWHLKTEWILSIEKPVHHIYGCPKAGVGFIWWRVCFSHQVLCCRTCSLTLMAGIFSTPELRTLLHRGPMCLLMRATEAGEKGTNKMTKSKMKWNN